MEDERTGTWRLSRVIGNNAAKVYLMCGHTAPYPNESSTEGLRAYGPSFGGTPKTYLFTIVPRPLFNV